MAFTNLIVGNYSGRNCRLAQYRFAAVMICVICISWSCHSDKVKDQIPQTGSKPRPRHVQKPAAFFHDTLYIDTPAAVFYYPDSIQLKIVADSLDSSVYKGIMHSYYYQVKTAHQTLTRLWPGLSIFEAKNFRYIKYAQKGTVLECVDINRKNELYGLMVFDGKKKPVEIDMTNLETQVSSYLQH